MEKLIFYINDKGEVHYGHSNNQPILERHLESLWSHSTVKFTQEAQLAYMQYR